MNNLKRTFALLATLYIGVPLACLPGLWIVLMHPTTLTGWGFFWIIASVIPGAWLTTMAMKGVDK